MALTQHRPHGALAGRRFGAFSGKPEGTVPVEPLTQHRPHGAMSGSRYGSFAGKTPSGGSEWDFAAPIDTPIAGTLTIDGDFDFGAPFELAQTAGVSLSGTLAVSGEFVYSDAPIGPPPPPPFTGIAGGGGMSNVPRRPHPATVRAEELEEAVRDRIRREDEMVFDCIAALVAAEVI